MKLRKKYKAGLLLALIIFLVLGGVIYIVLAPGRWSKEIVAYLNDNVLRENGWLISVGSIEGQLTSDIHFKNLYLRREDGSAILFSEHAKVNLDFTQILSGNWAISELVLDNALLTVRRSDTRGKPEFAFVTDLAQHGFKIREFSVGESALIVKNNEEETLYSFHFAGQISTSGRSLILSPVDFHIVDLGGNHDLRVTGGDLALGVSSVRATGFTGSFNDHPLGLNGKVTFAPSTEVSLDLTARRVVPDDYVSFRLSDVVKADTVDLQIQMETDMTSGVVQGLIYDSRTYEIVGEVDVDLARDSTGIHLNHGNIRIGASDMEAEGTVASKRDMMFLVRVNKLDLSEFGISSKPTDVSGTIKLTGVMDERTVKYITAEILLQNDQRGEPRFARASGIITYRDDVVEIPDHLTVDLDYGSMTAMGRINLDKERMSLSLSTEDVRLQSVAYVLGWPDTLSGRLRGTVELVGYLKDPSVNGYLAVEDGVVGKTNVSSLSASFLVNSLLKNRHGSLKAVASGGKIGDHPFDEGSLDVYFRGDTILIANARVEGGDDFIQASGKIVGTRSFVIDQVQSSFQDQYISSVGQVVIHRKPEGLVIEPAAARVNDGTIKGSLSLKKGSIESGSFHVVNLDLASLGKILGRKLTVVGAAFADFSASRVDDQPRVEGTLEVKDGSWSDIEFDNLAITCSFKDDQLYVKEMRLKRQDGMALQLSGFVTTRQDDDGLPRIVPDGEIGFSSEFRNVDLSTLSDYLPEWWHLDGAATGSFVMSGKANSSEMVFEVTISEPGFDRIHATTISASGRYMDHRLFFEDLEGYTSTGHYSGEGYLPLELDLVPREKDRFLETEPISMTFHANTTSLSFLTPYLADVDSVKGDMEIDLNVEGTPSNPVRNGRLVIRNGQIFALLLDFPIYQVDGSAVLKDNKFIIEELEAASHMPEDVDWASDLKTGLSKISGGILFGRGGGKSTHNLRITGSMDMEEFFHPNLAFLVTGKDVYVRTLLGEIEGIADISLSITGKDTLSTVGEIVPSEAVLRMEFAEEGSYNEVEFQGKTVAQYDLHFPIAGNLFVRNSQIDAEFDGDMTIYKLGNGPYRYSGELNILGGKFYYGSDRFDIQEGHLSFEPTEFNPKMDIHATTRISDIDIEVSLTGDFDEPTLIVEDSEQFYSQSDLLQLLTFQKRFGEQGLSTGSLSEQSVFLFGKYLEKELARSLARATPVLDQFEIEGSESLLGSPEESDLALKVGTRLTSNLYLSYKQKFSPTQPNQVGVEYRLNRNVSLVVTYDEDGQVHLKYRRKYQF